MKLKPLGDRVLIKPAPKEEKTQSGLFISSGAQEQPNKGEVVAVGAGRRDQDGKLIPMDVKVGDQVFYGKFGMNEIKIDGDEFILLHAEDVLAILED